MSVQQSGLITPGHVVLWATTGVVQDGGPIAVSQRNVMASYRSASLNTINDQPIPIPQRVVAFQLVGILITNASISLNTAAGGFYPQPGKGGVPIVEATQTYSLLSNSSLLLYATLSSFGQNTRFSSSNLSSIAGYKNVWFSLTTPQGVAATADIYVLGVDLT